jgi:hypothetical protein
LLGLVRLVVAIGSAICDRVDFLGFSDIALLRRARYRAGRRALVVPIDHLAQRAQSADRDQRLAGGVNRARGRVEHPFRQRTQRAVRELDMSEDGLSDAHAARHSNTLPVQRVPLVVDHRGRAGRNVSSM